MIFLKRVRFINRKQITKKIEEQTVGEKYGLIDKTLNSPRNVLTVSYLCESAGVSRSGFYSWKKRKNDPSSFYNKKDEQDRKDLS